MMSAAPSERYADTIDRILVAINSRFLKGGTVACERSTLEIRSVSAGKAN